MGTDAPLIVPAAMPTAVPTAVPAPRPTATLTVAVLAAVAVVAGIGTPAPAAGAEAEPAAATASAPRLPLWELGLFAGGGTQLAYPGAAQRVQPRLAVPYVIYRGRWLRAEQGRIGVRALKTERVEFDVGAAASFGSDAGASRVRRGMPDIGTLVEIGPRLRIALGDLGDGDAGPASGAVGAGAGRWRLELPLRGVFDLDDRLQHRGLAFEPEIGWSRGARGGWRYGASVSLLIGDERLADTFYGVDPAFATATRPAYDARAGRIATRLALNVSKGFGPDWRLFGFLRHDSVAGAANRASPLVERTEGFSGGIGLAWSWKTSSRAAAD